MPGYLSKKFHHETNHDFPIGTAPMNSQYWPKEWKEIHHKEYPRFPKISLPAYPLPLGELDKAFEDRRSAREYNINQSLTLDELNTLLYYSAGVKPSADYDTEVRRHYPSGGALYPLEMYLLIQRVVGIGPGIYHYNVKKHTLENLTSEKEEMEKLKDGLLYPWSRDGAVLFFIASVWDRNFVKYKDRGYRIALMEAGHMAQNLSLTAASLDIGCCPSVGFNNERVNEILNLESEVEDSLYLMIIGK